MITLKEEFLGSPKWTRAVELGGSDAIVMWLALKGYAASNPTDGFIPDDDVERLPGNPRAPRKALKALVECGRKNRNGSRGNGLVDPVENGWQLHDYLEHAPSSDEVAERRRKAKERKDRWRDKNEPGTRIGTRSGTEQERVPERSGNASGTRSGTHDGTRPPAGGGARVPSPLKPTLEEEDPPTPLRDPLGESLSGTNPRSRADVLAIFDAWKLEFGFPEAKLGLGAWNSDAQTLAECLDAHGPEVCALVLRHAAADGMVSGRDDERRVKHESVRYIFGNHDAFNRILRAARAAERDKGGSVADLMARKKLAGTEAAQ